MPKIDLFTQKFPQSRQSGIGSNGVKVNDTYASPDGNNVCTANFKKAGYLDKYLTAYKNPGKVRVIINPKYWETTNDLVGATIPAGLIVDVYQRVNTEVNDEFVCQYDTRDGSPLTITVAPGSAPKTVVTPARTSYNDVKPGDWYYEAVTALSEGGLIHTVFDTDPNGNFNPDAPVTQSEWDFIAARLRGQDTEGFKTNPNALARSRYSALQNLVIRLQGNGKSETTLTADELALAKQTNATYATCAHKDHDPGTMATAYYNVWKKAAARPNAEYYSSDSQTADAKAIRASADAFASKPGDSQPYAYKFAQYEERMRLAYNLGLVRLEGSPEVIDLNAPITRAEYCVVLYKTGRTSFGCVAAK